MGPYSFLPEVRQAKHRADEAERVAERLGDLLAQALSKLSICDLSEAQRLRGEAYQISRGVMPRVAERLHRIPLSRSADRTDDPERGDV